MLRDQIRMSPESVAGTLDLHDDCVAQQAVEQRGRDDGVAEHIAPFREAPVRRQDHRALFVAMILTSWKNRFAPPGVIGR